MIMKNKSKSEHVVFYIIFSRSEIEVNKTVILHFKAKCGIILVNILKCPDYLLKCPVSYKPGYLFFATLVESYLRL